MSFFNLYSQIESDIDSLYFQGKYEKASTGYSSLILKENNNAELYRKRGVCYLNQQKFDESIPDLYKSLSLEPDCYKCHSSLAYCYLFKNKLDSVMKHANSSLKIKPNGEAHFFRGIIFSGKKEHFDAISEFSEAIYLDSTFAHAYYRRGISYIDISFKSKGEKDILKAIEIDSNQIDFYYKLSLHYNTNKEFLKSIPYLEKCIRMDSNNSDFYKDLGSVNLYLENYKKSNFYYLMALEKGCEDPEIIYSYIADNHYRMEDMDSSCYYLKKTIELERNFNKETLDRYNDHCDTTLPNYYYQRGIAYFNLKNYKKSIEFHELGLSKFPNNGWLWDFRGNSLLADQQYLEAIKSYKKSLSLPSNEFAKENSKMNMKEYENASKCMTNISISDAYMELGDLPNALIHIDSSLVRLNKIEDGNTKQKFTVYILVQKGDYYYSNNEKNKAILEYDKALAIAPTHLEALFNRALCLAEKNNKNKKQYRSVGLNLKYQGSKIYNYNQTTGLKPKINKTELRQALIDLNTLISIDQSSGKAYLLRGIIKKQLQLLDYCMDINFAKDLGIKDANEIAETICK